MKNEMLFIDPNDDNFGAILNCAVRYSIGRQTYMPSLVVDFITPLIPYLNNRTLWCLDQDISEAKWNGGYGDPRIDEPKWTKLLDVVRQERIARGFTPHKNWREE